MDSKEYINELGKKILDTFFSKLSTILIHTFTYEKSISQQVQGFH